MATITAPSPEEVQRLANITAATLRMASYEEMLVVIGEDLVGIMSLLDIAVDEAAAPYGFPFTTDVMEAAYPEESSVERSQRATQQMRLLQQAAKSFAAAALFRRVAIASTATFSDDSYAGKARAMEAQGEKYQAAAIASIVATRTWADAAAPGVDPDDNQEQIEAETVARRFSSSVAQVVSW